MATKEELDNVYAAIRASEKELVEAIDAIAKDVTGRLDALPEGVPTNGQDSAACQLLNRVRGAVGMAFGFDLENVKRSYGVGADEAAEAPATEA